MFAAVAVDCGRETPVADQSTVRGGVELHVSMDDGLTFHDVCFPVARNQPRPAEQHRRLSRCLALPSFRRRGWTELRTRAY